MLAGSGAVGGDNKANGVRSVGSVFDISDAVAVDAGDTTKGGVGGNAASGFADSRYESTFRWKLQNSSSSGLIAIGKS
jgi:hypothetical protein